jgi:hypothetical protein
MQHRRIAVSALLSLFAIAAGLAAMASPASADDGNITVISAGPTGSNPAQLTVEIDDQNPGAYVTSLTVQLTNTVTSSQVTIQPDAWTYPDSGDPADQAVVMTSPIGAGSGPGQLPPGTYSMTVTATDSTDDTDSGLPAGTLAFTWTDPMLTASATPVSYGQAQTVSGALTGVMPGDMSGTQSGIGGEPVYLIDTGTSQSQQIAMTASDGSYSAQVRLGTDSYVVTVNPDPAGGVPSASSPPFTPAVTVDPTRLESVAIRPPDLVYGKAPGIMTGTAQYNGGSGWVSLGDSSVQITVGQARPVTVPTSANGSFSYTVPTTEGTSWRVAAGGTPLLDQSEAAGRVHIAVPVSVGVFGATLTTLGIIDASGCVRVTVPHFSPPGPGTRIEIQYAERRSGPWKTLGWLPIGTAASKSCQGAADAYFSGALTARLASAYYRADYPGDINFEHALSRAVRAWKYVTEVSSLRVSPRSVRHGGKITVSGRLRQYVRSWTDYARQQVLIILRPRGSRYWYWIYKVTTNSAGWFSKKFTDPTSATWSAEYQGNQTHLASVGASWYVPVHGKAPRAGLSAAQSFLLTRLPAGGRPQSARQTARSAAARP